jgi:hypothetical protein
MQAGTGTYSLAHGSHDQLWVPFPEYFGFPLSVSFQRCSITSKTTKNNLHLHLHHRVAQEASRLRYVRSVCCGALFQKKGPIHFHIRFASDTLFRKLKWPERECEQFHLFLIPSVRGDRDVPPVPVRFPDLCWIVLADCFITEVPLRNQTRICPCACHGSLCRAVEA